MPRKTIIITGASSGIGAACVESFSNAGFNIIAAGRNHERVMKVVEDISGASTWIGDLQSPDAAQNLVDHAINTFGSIDVLVNSAGIIYRADTEETTDSMWAETMAVNVTALFTLSRSALPHLRKTKGAIINIASDWGLRGGKKAMAYCASKGAVVQMSRAMALDHAHEGIRVNAICPGDVNTPMITNEIEQQGLDLEAALKQCDADSPTGRMTQPEEVAALALYLASDAARQITGAAMSIDGGTSV
ncbi:MAG: SDR family oxidoreductase [Rhodospirillales bacterium]|jgi:meso-butanediol dehydrogenase / (S,S)-butanediol dehydrogenase / diacetyl reductase|nr:SDR family oxidoreductase [Rhodospirillales bacterium]